MSQLPSSLELPLMREALELAARARGDVEPNPMVGCVIHCQGRIIGRGWHRQFGARHAEPDALANCSESPQGACAVVTLEPCCHTNKKTPPCVPALLAAGIARVVVGQIDPNPQVSGAGVAQLRRAGVDVVTGVLQAQCQQLNAAFYALVSLGRPYVTLKWAQSADGLMGGRGNTSRQISGPASSRLMHHLRTRSDAIMVSADTVISDDPLLTVRGVPLKRTPIRVIVDSQLRTPLNSRLVTSAKTIPTHLFTCKSEISPLGAVHIHTVEEVNGHVDFHAILHWLGEAKCSHLLIEPGPRLARALISMGLVDRIWVIQSPKAIGEDDAPRAPAIPWPAGRARLLAGDTLVEYLNPDSPCFFADMASPEFLLPAE